MYPEYEKVSAFLDEAKLLLDTPQRIEDIFSLTIARNRNNKAATYINAKGKLKSYNYKTFGDNTYIMANAIATAMNIVAIFFIAVMISLHSLALHEKSRKAL